MTTTSARPTGEDPDPGRQPEANAKPLGTRVRRGVVWSLASAALLKSVSVITTAVVAHILDPRDFGIFAVASTAYTIVSALGELGVGSCLLRADFDVELLAPTMSTVSVVTSVIQAAAMIAFAHPIATALGSPAAAGAVKVMAFVVIIVGIFTVPSARLIRDFKQDKVFLAEVLSFVASTPVLLLLAKSGNGAMSFAWSRVIGQFVSGCVLLASVPKGYRLGFSRSALSVLFKFGLPLGAANIVNYVLLNVDYALIGHLLGAVALGTYVLAFNVASWPSTLLGFMISNVSMPAFSRVKRDGGNLTDAMVSALRAVSLVVMPMTALSVALARPLVLTLYGAKWAASAEVLSILAVYGGVSIICVLFANILAGLGRTRILLLIQVIWIGSLIPAMAIGVHWDGILGAAIAHVSIIGPIVLPSYLLAVRKTTGVRILPLARAMTATLLASSAAAIGARVAASHFADPLLQLAAGLAFGGLIYLTAVAPQAIRLLNRAQQPGPRARRILRFYDNAARLVGLAGNSAPKHAVRGGRRSALQTPGRATLAEVAEASSGRIADARSYATSQQTALLLLMSMARPVPLSMPRVRSVAIPGQYDALDTMTMPLMKVV
jgi:lipopolysaccharide exporter